MKIRIARLLIIPVLSIAALLPANASAAVVAVGGGPDRYHGSAVTIIITTASGWCVVDAPATTVTGRPRA